MGEIKFLGGLVLFALFTIAIIGYAINFAIDNESAISISDDAQFNALNSNLQTNMSSFRTDAESGSQSLMVSNIETGGDNMESGGAFKVGITPMIKTLKAVTQTIKDKVFGGSGAFGIFITALVSLTIYTGFRYIWKTWKGGNPD